MVYFFSHKLGVSVPALGIKKDPFGAMCVTSLGMLGFENATAPFTGNYNIKVRIYGLYEFCIS